MQTETATSSPAHTRHWLWWGVGLLLTACLAFKACDMAIDAYIHRETDLSDQPRYADVMGQCFSFATKAIVWRERGFNHSGLPVLSIPGSPDQTLDGMGSRLMGVVPVGGRFVVSKILRMGGSLLTIRAQLHAPIKGVREVETYEIFETAPGGELVYDKSQLIPCDNR